ncbi:hypothetical protein COR50_18395 [Chitinophaga caeni]|uniref:Uncharacterized protein n=1 Tax=Chitinophaga caeni TaxID=2029983 RepID=A0A291QYJ1_9BACT|nr:hypothetical protein [Chitinophaga caeni]ATL48981.1 hypothetical protein COR50_18395 [Chitinophaga caeni]
MKFNVLAICAILVATATVCVSQVDAAKNRASHSFVYSTSGTDITDPAFYTEVSFDDSDCPNDGALCALIIEDNDVYTLAEVIAQSKPMSWVGKPKVDDVSTGALGAKIQNELSTPGENLTPDGNGRVVYERD